MDKELLQGIGEMNNTLTTLLWLYRRLPLAYGRVAAVEEAIYLQTERDCSVEVLAQIEQYFQEREYINLHIKESK